MSLLQRKSVEENGNGGPGAQRVVDERSAGATPTPVPNPELAERAHRRRFSSEYKLAMVKLRLPGEGHGAPGHERQCRGREMQDARAGSRLRDGNSFAL